MLRGVKLSAKTQRSTPASLPAPVGGWNVRDALANMDDKDAIILDNMFPTPSSVMVRNGYTQYATGLSGQVESVLTWTGLSTSKIFAASGTNFIDISAGGTATATAVSGLTNARWQDVNFTNAAGNVYLYAVNGSDHPWIYDGSTWTTGSAVGVTANNFINVNIFKSRLWAVEKDTLKAWYFNTGAFLGTANAVDLTGFTRMGGYLMAMGTWTLDAGSGVDDYAVFITSRGEVLVFQGTDPSSANTWAMKGRWELGAPIGRRCLHRLGGDLLLVCIDGVMPLSRALISSRVNPKVALTDKIQGAMSSAASLYFNNFGWQAIHYPKGDMLMVNVPVSVGSNQVQFAMNTITGSWGQFLDVEANCWALYNDEPYFGGNGFVGKFWGAQADNGEVINWEAQQAFSYFGSRGTIKQFYEARPIFQSSGTPTIALGINVDYDTTRPSATLNFSAPSYGIWDAGVWDSAIWGGSLSVIANWAGIAGTGVCAALHIIGQTEGIDTEWAATDYIFERGGMGTM